MLPVVAIEGRVTGEVQVKMSENGKAMGRFRVKAADRRPGDDGKWVEGDVLWQTIAVWGQLAQHCAESLRDGDQVLVIGRWSTAEWTDQNGNQRSAPRFNATAVGAGLQFAPRRHSGNQQSDQAQTEPMPSREVPQGFAGASAGVPGGDPWA